VLLDLIRALPAAVLVGVVPGWFWAGCLCAAADRAERLAYSVAFSVALVPTAALVQARLSGVGVAPAITVVSALLVLGTGLAIYLRLGPAKGSDKPLFSPPAPLTPPTLIPLIVASALVLGVLFGAVAGERTAHLFASPREDTPPELSSRPGRDIIPTTCRAFQDRTDLYRLVFENETVAIFEPRESQSSAVRQVAPAHPPSASSHRSYLARSGSETSYRLSSW
jgi:hypothetical protein